MTIATVILAILGFGCLIIVHEAGHFTAARFSGVRVNEFWIGMGPAIFKKKIGETEFKLCALPFGGACVMEGEDEDSDTEGSFNRADAPHRALIIAAGALMNFIAGLLIVLFCYAPIQTVAENTLESTEAGFAGAEQLKAGDTILSIDGYRILLNTDITVALSRGNDDRYDIKVRRGGQTLLLEEVPVPLTHFEGDPEGEMRYGLNFRTHDATIFDKLKYSVYTAFNYARLVWISLGDLISGAVGVDQLSGPVGVTDVLAETAQASFRSFLMMIAFISINLGVMNLLPLPALDGGRLLFILIELILRRPVNKKYEGYIHAGGLALLMALMLYVTFQDITRLIG